MERLYQTSELWKIILERQLDRQVLLRACLEQGRHDGTLSEGSYVICTPMVERGIRERLESVVETGDKELARKVAKNMEILDVVLKQYQVAQ